MPAGGGAVSELGQLLKKARMEKSLSLDDLQNTTKIQKRYLEAIEQGDYKMLPGSFYVRAFIKSYAEAVGLEPNEVLRLYRNVIPSPQTEQTLERPLRRKNANIRQTDRWNKWLSGIMLWAFIILIAAIIYYYVSHTHQDDNSQVLDDQNGRITDQLPAENSTADTSPAPLATDNQEQISEPPAPPPEKPKQDVKLAKTVSGEDFYDVLNSETMRVELTVTGDSCWIQFDELLGEGKSRNKETKTLVNGDTRSWELAHSAFLIVGKANAIDIKVNGTTIPVGDTPNPKHFEFDLQNS
jgi:cytoskeletal protein RodZ